MGRLLRHRVLCDNGVYHIIMRGHNRYKLFNQLTDYKKFKDVIREYKKRYIFYLFHYCFMPNHIHMLLRIKKGPELPSLMQGINQTYARYYKRQYGLIGNLFQGRYKSFYIDKDEYLLECGRYIERNPLRANMVGALNMYYFSSYNIYTKSKGDDIITYNPLYLELSKDPKERMKLYREYVEQPRPYEQILDDKLKL